MFRYLFCCFAVFSVINTAPNALCAADFVVGTTSGYAPYVSLNQEGGYEGFDIDLAKEISVKLDRKLVIRDLGSMPSLFLSLRLGKIDAIMWAISITEERQKQMEMVYYQGEREDRTPLLFWKTIPQDITGLDDMEKKPQFVVVAEAGSYQDSILRNFPGINVKLVDKVTDAILEIKYGKATAAMIDPSLVALYTQRFPELIVVWSPLPNSLQSLGNGIAINKKNDALAGEIRSAVDALLAEGKILELEKKWNLRGQ